MLLLLARWLARRNREHKNTLIDPRLFRLPNFRLGISGQALQNIVLGGSMIALPIFLQISLEYNALKTGLSIAPLSLSMLAIALIAGRRWAHIRVSKIIKYGFLLTTFGLLLLLPVVPRANSGWLLCIPLLIVGSGLGLLVSQLNNYSLAPIDEERISEAAGVNSAAGSFGLSFGLAIAGGILLAALSFSFSKQTNDSIVIPAAQQQQIASELEHSAEVVSNTQLKSSISNQPKDVQTEVLAINKSATHRALQVALLVPLLAAAVGSIVSFRMEKLPEVKPSPAAEVAALG
jgi:Na+/melibiose symporter-like transporter